MKDKMRKYAEKIYNYHNLGTGIFPKNEEKTPYGSGERYNYDRMAMMVTNYDFTGKNIVDLGCNSGWFCLQAKLLGTNVTVGIDDDHFGIMGKSIHYAILLEKKYKLGMSFINRNLETIDFLNLSKEYEIPQFDVSLLLSTFHHIMDKNRLFSSLFDATREVIFYEDHEFWNQMVDSLGKNIPVKGEGHRYGWNEDMSWQRKISSIESYETKILTEYRKTWRKEVLMFDRFKEIRFLGFSEKRRPMLALIKEVNS